MQRSATVKLPIDRVEKCWSRFIAHQIVEQRPMSEGGNDPGIVYFNDAGNGKTEVTIEIDASGIAQGDEQTLNGQVETYLDHFKRFAEQQ